MKYISIRESTSIQYLFRRKQLTTTIMFSNTSAELSLNAPSRCISSVQNDTRNHRFLVGTCTLPPPQQNNRDYMGGNAPVNPLYLLRYHEEMNEMAVDAQLDFGEDEDASHGEIWSCSSCPLDSSLVITCRSANDGTIATSTAQTETALWRIPETAMKVDDIDFYPDESDCDQDRAEELTKSMGKVCDLDLGPGRVTDMQWNPGCIPNCNDFDESIGQVTGANLITVQSGNRELCVTFFDVDSSYAAKLDQVNFQIPNTRGYMPNPPKASWDPHNHNLCAVTLGTNLAILDMRTPAKLTNGLKSCHRFGVTDLDYNPNKPNVLSSSGQDGLIKFWDLRFTASYNDEPNGNTSSWARHSPLRTVRGGHTHWTTCVKYNSFHDQLILSGGTDSIVNLWRISSISSAPLIDLGGSSADDDFAGADDDHSHDDNPVVGSFENVGENTEDADGVGTDGGNAPDVRVTKMEMREAIYDLTWSAADPWLFVTLGYDGNVVLNHVPSKEKYKILL